DSARSDTHFVSDAWPRTGRPRRLALPPGTILGAQRSGSGPDTSACPGNIALCAVNSATGSGRIERNGFGHPPGLVATADDSGHSRIAVAPGPLLAPLASRR